MRPSFCDNVNGTNFTRCCLLKYITLPFDCPPLYHKHQNMWQVPEIARIIGEFEYNVDVINYDDREVRLSQQYDLLLDIYPQNHAVYANHLASDCIKIAYTTGASPDWQNRAEKERIDDLWRRRQARMPAKAWTPPFGPEINSFDALFLIGNQHTLNTYGDLSVPSRYLLPNSAYPFGIPELAKKSPAAFLFLATYPQMLKGLDLLLEVFAQNPDLSLVICSQFAQEKDFCAIYDKELYHLPNIVPAGPVDITGKLFRKIIDLCSYVVLPSCSEGMSGSVLTAMSAGLIPLVSRECGLNEDETHYFPENSIECIQETLRYFAQKPFAWIDKEALRVQQIAGARYSTRQFSTAFRRSLKSTLANKGRNRI